MALTDAARAHHAELIRRTYELFNSDDAHSMADLWCDDIEWHIGGNNLATGTHVGADQILEMLGDVVAATQGTFQVEIKDIAISDDRGYSLHKATAVTADGVAEFWAVLVFHFRHDKIARVWNFASEQAIDDRVLS
jgi:ketosteroid isomerase-like protein